MSTPPRRTAWTFVLFAVVGLFGGCAPEVAHFVDSPPPAGWEATPFASGTVPIQSAVGDLRVEVYRTASLSDGRIRAYVNVIDAAGRIVTGVGSADQLRAWCRLVDSSGSGIRELPFTVHEKTIVDTLPVALVLALDHSGSMGEDRTRRLQEAANELLQLKRPIDAVGVVKFDQSTDVERALTVDTSGLPIIGARGFGGETAMFDACRVALRHAIDSRSGRHAAGVVLLSDGDDNASVTRPNEVVELARAAGVPVFTVSFGPWLACPSARALGEISALTGGRTYRVYSRGDFAPVFADVLRRLTSHYVVEYRSADSGWHNVSLLGCRRGDTTLASARYHVRGGLPRMAEVDLPPLLYAHSPELARPLAAATPMISPELELETVRRTWLDGTPGRLYRVTMRDPALMLDSAAMFFPLAEFIRPDIAAHGGTRGAGAFQRLLDRLELILEGRSSRSYALLVQGHADAGFGKGRDNEFFRTVRGMSVDRYLELEPNARALMGRAYDYVEERGGHLRAGAGQFNISGPGYSNRELAFLRGVFVRDLIRTSGHLAGLPLHVVDGVVDQVRDPRRRTCTIYLFEEDAVDAPLAGNGGTAGE